MPYTRAYNIILETYPFFPFGDHFLTFSATFYSLARLLFSGATFFSLARLFFLRGGGGGRLFFTGATFFLVARPFF